MAASALNVLSGIGAAVAGLAGETVSKTGSIPGFDLATIVPALLGNKTGTTGGGAGGMAATLVSAVAKSGLLNNVNLVELAGSLLSFGNSSGTTGKTTTGGVAGLAKAIIGNSGKGADLGSIATLASSLAGSVKDKKGLTSIASDLGKTLSSSFGVNFEGGGSALKSLDSAMGGDIKTDLFKAVLKGLS